MPKEEYQIVAGFIIGIIILLSAALFIILLIAYSNRRKRTFLQEKQLLHQQFTEQLLQSQLEMQEHTFNMISQEIHDNIGQTLSLARIQLNIIDQNDGANSELIKDVRESVSRAMNDLRDIAKSLNSDRIRMLSLLDMTVYELQRIQRLGTMKTNCRSEGKELEIPEQKKLILFRIIQESLQNILKHAKAENINVLFKYGINEIEIEIADDGVGFDPALLTNKDGLGLQNIITRAALVGGRATINSSFGAGTSVSVRLQINETKQTLA